jgi:hypothetical protein
MHVYTLRTVYRDQLVVWREAEAVRTLSKTLKYFSKNCHSRTINKHGHHVVTASGQWLNFFETSASIIGEGGGRKFTDQLVGYFF